MKTTSIAEATDAIVSARRANAMGCEKLAAMLVKGYPLVILLAASKLLADAATTANQGEQIMKRAT